LILFEIEVNYHKWFDLRPFTTLCIPTLERGNEIKYLDIQIIAVERKGWTAQKIKQSNILD